MRRSTLGRFALAVPAALLVGCNGDRPLAPSDAPALARGGKAPGIATLTALPSLGSNSEALAVDGAGTVIVGHSFDRAGMLYAVKWTWQNGTWVLSTLPSPAAARATGVDDQQGVVGYGASIPQAAFRWSAAGERTALNCVSDIGQSRASAISADGQLAVGAGAGAAIWRAGGCQENLPALSAEGGSTANTVNGDGTIVGGSASLSASGDATPVRWRAVAGQWQSEQLDGRRGSALGANGAGDLAGFVAVPCELEFGCGRSMVWYAAGGSRDLGTLGGARSTAFDINSAGEVVGVMSANGRDIAYIWSESRGTIELPAKRGGGVARAVSDVRADGTRLVVGMSGSTAAVWVVRNP